MVSVTHRSFDIDCFSVYYDGYNNLAGEVTFFLNGKEYFVNVSEKGGYVMIKDLRTGKEKYIRDVVVYEINEYCIEVEAIDRDTSYFIHVEKKKGNMEITKINDSSKRS